MTNTIEQFACVPLGTKLTRSTCASRHRRAKREQAGKTTKGQSRLVDVVCHGCPIGAAHAREEQPTAWPDGADVELSQLTLPSPGSQSLTGGGAESKGGSDATEQGKALKSDPAPELAAEPVTGARSGAPTTTTKTTREEPVAKTAECARCEKAFTKTHGRQKYCTPCRPLAAKERKAALKRPPLFKKKATKKKSKKKAGDALNALFSKGADAKPTNATNATNAGAEPSDTRRAALGTVVRDADHHAELAAELRTTANQLAALWGMPLPFEDETAPSAVEG